LSAPQKLELVHATAVAIDRSAVLIIGKSGSGKSDLALRLIDRGALLISDDIVQVDGTAAPPTLHPAPNIAGKIEIRGIGVISIPHVEDISLRLVVNLDSTVERLPFDRQTHSIAAFDVPTINLGAFEASAPIKIEYALRSLVDGAIFPVATQSSVAQESETA
jgi:HPr kinase/phosphorylase